MCQRFRIVAPHERKFLGYHFKLRQEMLMNNLITLLVDVLAIPFKSHECPPCEASYLDPKIRLLRANRLDDTSGTWPTISSLPPKIQLMIFDRLECMTDRMALAATNNYFFELSLPALHDGLASHMGPWAGKNIVCVGEDVKPGDLPPGLFAEEGEHGLSLRKIQRLDEDGYTKESEPAPLQPSHYSRLALSLPLKVNAYRDYIKYLQRANGSTAEVKLISPDMTSTLWLGLRSLDLYPKDQPWILRNLTTKEFVRAEAIALKPEYMRGPLILGIGFGHVVMSRICWSSGSSVGTQDASNISRGVWAGHRFDIIAFPKHVEATKGEEWVDVSDEVVDEIARIWEAECGSNWREEVIEEADWEAGDILMNCDYYGEFSMAKYKFQDL
ncbi:hypothetical protein F5Y13DRAFT_187979 [Hypoxylon sp. FL1857]|nr:hypothetical protein F5Y13DRAFT_187979 [Hypoxylon sp. FL1857]